MTVTVNSEPLDWEEGLSIQNIIEQKEIDFPMLVVRLNGKMVSRHDYDKTTVNDGDVVSIIMIHAGG